MRAAQGTTKISEYFKSKRVGVNLSQQDVAKALGFTTGQFISNWERGLSFPPMQVLPKLVKLYKINKNELVNVYLEEQKKMIRGVLR